MTMKAMKWLGFGLLCTSLFAACGDEASDSAEAGVVDAGAGDTSVFDGTAATDVPETPQDTGPVDENFGDTCTGSIDCDSALCIEVSGVDEGFCSRFCGSDADCPDDGWECLFFVNTGGDAASVCLPTELCVDEDGDGFGQGPGCDGPDCDDTLETVFIGADEVCNGFDDDCDGAVEENVAGLNEVCDTGIPGACGTGRTS